jgi:hypothetical protein
VTVVTRDSGRQRETVVDHLLSPTGTHCHTVIRPLATDVQWVTVGGGYSGQQWATVGDSGAATVGSGHWVIRDGYSE